MNGSFCSAEAIERCRRGLQRAIEVIDDRQDPRDGQLRRALEIRIVDAPLESLDPLDRGLRAVVVTNLDRSNGRDQQQLGLRAILQCVGSEQ